MLSSNSVIVKSSSHLKWIDAGYTLLGTEGAEGLQVERLARIVSMNKSGFYHYFGDHENFMAELMSRHCQYTRVLGNDAQFIRTFDPEYINLLVKHKAAVLVNMQLMRDQHHTWFPALLNQLNTRIDCVVSSLWANYIGMPGNPDLALRYYDMVRNTLYVQISSKNFNYNFLHNIFSNARAIAQELRTDELLADTRAKNGLRSLA